MHLPKVDVPFRKEKGLFTVAVGIGSAALLAQPVGAADVIRQPDTIQPDAINPAICSSLAGWPYHCYAIAETDGFIADGAAARFDSRQYVTQDWQKGGFTEQTLWVGVQNSTPGTEWCEVGWTKGWINPSSGEPQASVSHYYAFLLDETYNEAFPASPAVGPVGTSHHYQVLREYDGKYNFYIDNIDVGDCHADPFTLWAQVGLEYTHPFNSANQNDPRDLEWRRSTDLSWFDWGAFDTRVDAYELSDNNRAQWNWETYPTSGENWIGP